MVQKILLHLVKGKIRSVYPEVEVFGIDPALQTLTLTTQRRGNIDVDTVLLQLLVRLQLD
jgi:hypothetical protein